MIGFDVNNIGAKNYILFKNYINSNLFDWALLY